MYIQYYMYIYVYIHIKCYICRLISIGPYAVVRLDGLPHLNDCRMRPSNFGNKTGCRAGRLEGSGRPCVTKLAGRAGPPFISRIVTGVVLRNDSSETSAQGCIDLFAARETRH